MGDTRWLVSFQSGPMTKELNGAISAAGFALASEADAIKRVRQALEPHAAVGDPQAQSA